MSKQIGVSALEIITGISNTICAPVNTLCNFITKSTDAKNQIKIENTRADIAKQEREHVAEIKQLDRENEAKLQKEMHEFNANMTKMIDEHKLATHGKLLDSVKRYQMELAIVSKEIAEQIGIMSIELRNHAHNMVLEKTNAYIEMQEKAKGRRKERLLEIKNDFADDEYIYKRLVDSEIDQCNAIVDAAKKFIEELNEDIKRINANVDELVKIGIQNSNKYLEPLSHHLDPIAIETNHN